VRSTSQLAAEVRRGLAEATSGEPGTIHELNNDYVVVLLDRVTGKFKSRHLRCAPEMVEPEPDR